MDPPSKLVDADKEEQSPDEVHAVNMAIAQSILNSKHSAEHAKSAAAATAAGPTPVAVHVAAASAKLQAVKPAEPPVLSCEGRSCNSRDGTTAAMPRLDGLITSAGPGAAGSACLPAAAAAGIPEPPGRSAQAPGFMDRLDAVVARMQSPAYQSDWSTGLFRGRRKAVPAAAGKASGVPGGISAPAWSPASQLRQRPAYQSLQEDRHRHLGSWTGLMPLLLACKVQHIRAIGALGCSVDDAKLCQQLQVRLPVSQEEFQHLHGPQLAKDSSRCAH